MWLASTPDGSAQILWSKRNIPCRLFALSENNQSKWIRQIPLGEPMTNVEVGGRMQQNGSLVGTSQHLLGWIQYEIPVMSTEFLICSVWSGRDQNLDFTPNLLRLLPSAGSLPVPSPPKPCTAYFEFISIIWANVCTLYEFESNTGWWWGTGRKSRSGFYKRSIIGFRITTTQSVSPTMTA